MSTVHIHVDLEALDLELETDDGSEDRWLVSDSDPDSIDAIYSLAAARVEIAARVKKYETRGAFVSVVWGDA